MCYNYTVVLRHNGVWLSLVERDVRDVEVAGSNPVTPTKKAMGGFASHSFFALRFTIQSLATALLANAGCKFALCFL